MSIIERHPAERSDYVEYEFLPHEGSWADRYKTRYHPIHLSEEQADNWDFRNIPPFPSEHPGKRVISCCRDAQGRIFVYLGPRQIQNHQPEHFEKVRQFFEWETEKVVRL